MLKLLVADDERILREAVCYLIDWKSIGIELAESCKNGREAYEEACRTKPDIILTDIKCPAFPGWTLWKSSRAGPGAGVHPADGLCGF
ncbi:MAG: response regulator [Ruthenibacterium lactatiformans]